MKITALLAAGALALCAAPTTEARLDRQGRSLRVGGWNGAAAQAAAIAISGFSGGTLNGPSSGGYNPGYSNYNAPIVRPAYDEDDDIFGVGRFRDNDDQLGGLCDHFSSAGNRRCASELPKWQRDNDDELGIRRPSFGVDWNGLRRRMFSYPSSGPKRYTADQRRCKHLKKMYKECRMDCRFILPGGNCGKHINKYKRIATKPCGRWEKLRSDQGSNSMRSCERTCRRNHAEAHYC